MTDSQGGSTLTTATTYDPDGNVVKRVLSGLGQTDTYTATVNPADWVTGASGGGAVVTYSRDGAARTRLLGQGGGAISLTYALDNEGRAGSLTEQDGSNSWTTSFQYNPDDLPTSWAGRAEELVHSATYDPANRLTQFTVTDAGITLVSALYAYDPVGTTNTITNTVGTSSVLSLTHDSLDRLIGTSGASSASWTYDGRGNITTVTTPAGLTSYSYSAANPDQLSSVSRPGQPTVSYGYDNEGHATSISPQGGTATTLGYDVRGRLTSVTLASGTVVRMGYNAAGQRASYTVTPKGAASPSTSESFLYRGSQLSQEVVITGTTTYTDTFVYAQSGAPLMFVRQQGTSVGYYWYVLDGRGDVVGLRDRLNAPVASYSYDLWGNPTGASESVVQPLRYAGYVYDRELGWYWLSTREYDPALERFLAPDPSEQEGLFSYVYAHDDPVDAADPSGLSVAYSCGLDYWQDGVEYSTGPCNPPAQEPCYWVSCPPSEQDPGLLAALEASDAQAQQINQAQYLCQYNAWKYGNNSCLDTEATCDSIMQSQGVGVDPTPVCNTDPSQAASIVAQYVASQGNDDSEKGSCGTISYELWNLADGEALSVVEITSRWGSIITASYSASWYNNTYPVFNGPDREPVDYGDSTGPAGGTRYSEQILQTGPGLITGVVSYAKDIVLNPIFGPLCQTKRPLVSQAVVTGF